MKRLSQKLISLIAKDQANLDDLKNAYVEIFLTKIISKENLLKLLNEVGITFDKDFDLKKASQFDMGVILMNDLPNEKLLPKIRDLQKNKYSWIKSLEEVEALMNKVNNRTEEEIAKYYIQISTDNTMQDFVANILNGTNKALVYKKDLLSLVVGELIKKEDI